MRWIFVVAMLVGCSKQQAEKLPSCAEISAKVAEVTRIKYPGHGDMEMGDSKRDIAACEKSNPSAAERRCIMAAKDFDGVMACRKAALKK